MTHGTERIQEIEKEKNDHIIVYTSGIGMQVRLFRSALCGVDSGRLCEEDAS